MKVQDVIVRKIGELYTHRIDAEKARREKKENFRRTKKFMGDRLQMCYLKKLGRQQYYSRAKEQIEQDIKKFYSAQIETRQILIGSTELGSKIGLMKSKGGIIMNWIAVTKFELLLVKTTQFSKLAVTQLIKNMEEYYCGDVSKYNNLVSAPKLRESQRDLRQEDPTKQSERYPVKGGQKIPYRVEVLSCW